MFLATTALRQFWDLEQDLLLLGPWCLTREGHECRQAPPRSRMLESPWEDAREARQALQRYEAAREKLLLFLTEKLNALHGTNHAPRYWRILLGPWLMGYVSAFCDRELHLRAAWRAEPGLSTWRLDTSLLRPPRDAAHFARLAAGDEFNLGLYSQVVERLGLPAQVRPWQGSVAPAPAGGWRAKAWGFLSRADRGLRRLGAGEAFFSDLYLDRPSAVRLMRASGWRARPLLERLPPRFAFEASVDSRRLSLAEFPAADAFEGLLGKCLPSHLPTLYLEGYAALRRRVLSGWRRPPKLLMTAVGWYFNEYFKLLAAESVGRGGRLVICQHGGAYGMFEPLETERHERAVADEYWTWGWKDERGGAALKPLPMPRLSSLRRHPPASGGDLLLVCNSMPRYPYSYYFANVPVWHRFERHLEERRRFVERLPQALRQRLRVRLAKDDFGWGQRRRLEARCPGLGFDEENIPWPKRLESIRLAVIDQPQSTYLESLAADVPTVLFWTPELWNMRAEALPAFELLRRAGILYNDPESAAEQVASVWGDPASWWAREEVQSARREFCARFALADPNWERAWGGRVSALLESGPGS